MAKVVEMNLCKDDGTFEVIYPKNVVMYFSGTQYNVDSKNSPDLTVAQYYTLNRTESRTSWTEISVPSTVSLTIFPPKYSNLYRIHVSVYPGRYMKDGKITTDLDFTFEQNVTYGIVVNLNALLKTNLEYFTASSKYLENAKPIQIILDNELDIGETTWNYFSVQEWANEIDVKPEYSYDLRSFKFILRTRMDIPLQKISNKYGALGFNIIVYYDGLEF